MAYVVRTSVRINADIARGYSCNRVGYQKPEHSMLFDGIEAELEAKFPSAESRDIREMALERLCGEFLGGLVQDDYSGLWFELHHFGLSCYRLEADTKDAALAEAMSQDPYDGGVSGGDVTVGTVRLIASWRKAGYWMHLLWCEDVRAEN